MDLGLKGRNAIVLGGTRGIGRAIAGTLAGEGSGVAVCARNADQVASTVAELKAMGGKATGAPVDVTDAAALKSWISDAATELGSVDMLFGASGGAPRLVNMLADKALMLAHGDGSRHAERRHVKGAIGDTPEAFSRHWWWPQWLQGSPVQHV